MNSHYAGDRPDDSDARHEQELRQESENREIRNTEYPAHVHGALEESLLTLETMSADGACGIHAQATGKHFPLEAHGAALCDDGAQAR